MPRREVAVRLTRSARVHQPPSHSSASAARNLPASTPASSSSLFSPSGSMPQP